MELETGSGWKKAYINTVIEKRHMSSVELVGRGSAL